MEVYIIYMTTYACKQRIVALLLMELSKMRKMQTISSRVRTNAPGAQVRMRTKYLMLQTNTPSLSD